MLRLGQNIQKNTTPRKKGQISEIWKKSWENLFAPLRKNWFIKLSTRYIQQNTKCFKRPWKSNRTPLFSPVGNSKFHHYFSVKIIYQKEATFFKTMATTSRERAKGIKDYQRFPWHAKVILDLTLVPMGPGFD